MTDQTSNLNESNEYDVFVCFNIFELIIKIYLMI